MRLKTTGRVKKFILQRREVILDDITPTPPEWPEPDEDEGAADSGSLEVDFTTRWGSNASANPLAEGKVTRLVLNEQEEPSEGILVVSGHANDEERALLPFVPNLASIAVFGVDADGSVSGMTIVMPLAQITAGARLVIGEDLIAGGTWNIPAGGIAPDSFSPFTSGVLELKEADTDPGAAISGSFSGVFGAPPTSS